MQQQFPRQQAQPVEKKKKEAFIVGLKNNFNFQNVTKTTILKIISVKMIQSKMPFSLWQTSYGKIEKLDSLPWL